MRPPEGSQLERRARAAWKAHAKQLYFGRCDVCGQIEDAYGHPLLVARQPRRRERECLDCWEARQ
jgi:hypothetical protein